ncbi:hypothetical protein OKW43_008592 [Paraburkholderia sp. WC7.3g]
MFRVQVWNDDVNRDVDVVISFDHLGPVGFRRAQPGDHYAARHVDRGATL